MTSNKKTGILALTPEDLDSLPDQLIKQLSVSEDKPEIIILKLIEEAGGIISIDRLLIGLYKKTEVVWKRNCILSKLYHMKYKKLVRSKGKHKNVIYSLDNLGRDQLLFFKKNKNEEP